jgi:tRNA(Ile)-lysidine synthase
VALEPLGITVERLASTVRNLADAQSAIRGAVARKAEGLFAEVAGSLSFERDGLLWLGNEIERRLLLAIIRWIGRPAYPPREAKLIELSKAIYGKREATLGGVRFRWSGTICTASREKRVVGGPVVAGQVWDGRWDLRGGEGEIRALDTAGLRQCPDWRATGLPRHVLEVTPGLWDGDTLLAAPCAGFGTATATCAPSFRDMLLSH